MKIYNKKTFWYGIGFIVLGTLQLMISIWKGFDLKGTGYDDFMPADRRQRDCSAAFPGRCRARTRSRNWTSETVWSSGSAKSRALGIAELVCFVCMLLSIFGMQAMEAFFGGMLVAFGLIFTTMLIIECITLLYYNKKL